MNELGKPLTPGPYVLNGSILVDVDRYRRRAWIKMSDSVEFDITTSVYEGDKWKIWYLVKGQEQAVTLTRASI